MHEGLCELLKSDTLSAEYNMTSNWNKAFRNGTKQGVTTHRLGPAEPCGVS